MLERCSYVPSGLVLEGVICKPVVVPVYDGLESLCVSVGSDSFVEKLDSERVWWWSCARFGVELLDEVQTLGYVDSSWAPGWGRRDGGEIWNVIFWQTVEPVGEIFELVLLENSVECAGCG